MFAACSGNGIVVRMVCRHRLSSTANVDVGFVTATGDSLIFSRIEAFLFVKLGGRNGSSLSAIALLSGHELFLRRPRISSLVLF